MVRHALSLLTHRKKSGTLLILLLAFAFFLLGSVPALFSEQDRLWFDREAEVRGIFDGIFFDMTDAKLEKLQQSGDVSQVGLVHHYGVYPVLELTSSVSVGTFDKTALEIGRLQAVEGRLPTTKKEVALSVRLKSELPAGMGLGSEITLVMARGTKTYTICGFVEDYLKYWVQGASAKLQVKELPTAFVTEEGAPFIVTQTDALVYMERLEVMEDAGAHFTELSQTLSMTRRYERTYNRLLYGGMSFENRVFQSTFTFVILAGVATVSYIALIFYLRNYRDVARKLYLTGASTGYTLFLLYLWMGFLTIISILVSIGFHMIFSAVMKQLLEISIPLSSLLWSSVLVLIGLARILILYHRREIEPLREGSMSFHNESISKKEIRLTGDLQTSFSIGRAQKGRKRLRLVYLAMAIVFALFLCVNEDVQNRLGLTFHKGVFTFSASMEEIRLGADMQSFGDFRLTAETAGLSREEAWELMDMPGVKSAKLEYAGVYPSLIIENQEKSIYAQALHREDGEESRILTAPAVPENTWATTKDMDHFSIYVLSQKQIYIFEELFPKVSSKTDLDKGEAVVFCLPALISRREAVSNDLYFEGDDIKFGFLSTDATLREAMTDPSLVNYDEVSFEITEVITEEGYWGNMLAEDLNDAGMAWDDVIVVISEETAASSGLCDQVSHIELTMSAGVTEKAYNACKTRLQELVGSAYAMHIDEPDEAVEYDAEMVAPVLTIQYFLIVILSVFMLYALFLVLHDSFAQYRQSFGILRSLGCRKKWFFGTVLQEFMIYWAELSAICFAFVLVIQTVYFPIFPYKFWPAPFEGFPYVLRTALARSGIFAAGALLLCFFAAVYFTHSLWKKSITTAIRFNE